MSRNFTLCNDAPEAPGGFDTFGTPDMSGTFGTSDALTGSVAARFGIAPAKADNPLSVSEIRGEGVSRLYTANYIAAYPFFNTLIPYRIQFRCGIFVSLFKGAGGCYPSLRGGAKQACPERSEGTNLVTPSLRGGALSLSKWTKQSRYKRLNLDCFAPLAMTVHVARLCEAVTELVEVWLLSEVEIHEAIQIQATQSGLLRSATNDICPFRDLILVEEVLLP